MDYPGKIINKNATLPTQASASGVWTVDDALIALRSNTWPIAGVLNPISKSLRFNSADSAYLNRTPTSASNRTTWTWSGWIKRSASTYGIFEAGTTNNITSIAFSSDTIQVQDFQIGVVNWTWITSAVFRDYSAWYHIVVAYDTTQASSANAVKIYVNGTQQTAPFATNGSGAYSQNRNGYVNSTSAHQIGTYNISGNYLSAYMTEVNFIDGQALTPSSFGATDAQTGQWIPKKYTGTYGTNGFYLNFSDSASTGALGTDYSGNGNNWTPNNFSVTAGAGNDSLTDVPTPWIAYSTNSEVGGVIRGNYCTLNPLANNGGTLANGNLDHTGTTALTASTLFPSTGKWYCEFTCTAYGGGASLGYTAVGVIQSSQSINTVPTTLGTVPVGLWIYRNDAQKANNGASASYGNTWTANDVIGIAVDLDAATLTFYKNGVSQGTAYTNLSGSIAPAINDQGSYSSSFSFNAGQRPFAYTPPTGYKSLCATNLPTPTIGATTTTQADRFFTPNLWAGNNGAQTITNNIDTTNGGGLIWFKGRDVAVSNFVVNSNSGYTKFLASNTTAAEDTYDFGFTPSTTGFSFNSGSGSVNQSGYNYVAWQWKAGGTGVTNTAGSITSTVSANTTSGFSIVTWTGTGSAGSVGHGLGVAPNLIIIKGRNISGATSSWWTWCSVLTSPNANWWRNYLTINTTSAVQDWGDNSGLSSAPSSTVLNIGNYSGINGSSNTFVAYCFAEVAGYSRIGSYTGNGNADGPFVFCGFRPRYILIKCSNSTEAGNANWIVYDSARNTYNAADKRLYPDLSNAEGTNSIFNIDLVSNGFKIRAYSVDTGMNNNGNTYIFAAFAEFPFKFANAR